MWGTERGSVYGNYANTPVADFLQCWHAFVISNEIKKSKFDCGFNRAFFPSTVVRSKIYVSICNKIHA